MAWKASKDGCLASKQAYIFLFHAHVPPSWFVHRAVIGLMEPKKHPRTGPLELDQWTGRNTTRSTNA